MDIYSKMCFINHLCICKEDVLQKIRDYIEHCRETNEEGWSDSKRKVILKLLHKFYTCVEDTKFPDVNFSGWYYEYNWMSDGIKLELLHCDDIEFDEEGELESIESSESFVIAEVKCDYLTVEEYANKYGVTVIAVRQWIRRGKLRSAKKVGRDWIIPELTDKPKRGYEPVTYNWDYLPDDLLKQFPFLDNKNSVNIMQDQSNKSMYIIDLLSQNGYRSERRFLDVTEREKLELALISETNVECEEWYSRIIFSPAKQESYRVYGGDVMKEREYEQYNSMLKMLQEEDLEIFTSNHYYDKEGLFVWAISAQLDKWSKDDLNDNTHTVVWMKNGIIIPPEIQFFDMLEFDSAADLCDAFSADMLATYRAVANENEGIKPEIIRELGMNEEDSYESSLLYIEDIEVEDLEYLKKYLDIFDLVVEGLPSKGCRFAMVLMNWEKENKKAKTFLECGWKIKNIDASCIVAYRKL